VEDRDLFFFACFEDQTQCLPLILCRERLPFPAENVEMTQQLPKIGFTGMAVYAAGVGFKGSIRTEPSAALSVFPLTVRLGTDQKARTAQ